MDHQLTQQITCLSPRHPLRQIAEVILAGKPAPYGCVDALLNHATDASPRSWPAQVVAVRLLARFGNDRSRDEIIRTLGTLLRDEATPSNERVYRGFLRTALSTSASVLVVVLACAGGLGNDGLLRSDAVSSLTMSVAGFGYLALVSTALGLLCLLPTNTLARSFAARDNRTDQVRAAAAHSLGEIGAVTAISTLAFASMDHSPGVRVAARGNLARLVSLLTEDDFGLLEADTVSNLCRLLRPEDQEVSLLALEALRKVGDGKAIRPVAHLAASRCPYRVRDAAERLLPVLKERHAAAMAPTRLLRPSFAPGLNDDLLLMAVRNHPTDHLPRPASPE